MKRRFLPLLALVVFSSLGAQERTTNFVINAPTPAIAKQVAQYAEYYRKTKAIEWLGREMPNWPQPCPLTVTVTLEPPSGATSFSFGGGQVQWQKMEIQGPLDRLLASVLPHEITHTVFAHHFGQPVPRWADEGGSVCSEDDIERKRHDRLVRDILNGGKQIPLRRLMSLREYPRDVMCLYAQGFSMSDYLVRRSNKQTFLNFVASGMSYGWDKAVQTHYGHRSVEELEEAWLQYLRDTKGGATVDLAKGAAPSSPVPAAIAARNVVRLTAPPAQPLDPEPTFRGAMPSAADTGRFGSPPPPPPYPTPGPGWQPVYPAPTVVPVPTDRSAPVTPAVRLGAPVFGS
ncbi:MAG: hypothetical protein U0793_09335 [Gemmataceae bacterium]